jgi:hypothetical protein
MINATLFTRHQFKSEEDAAALFKLLNEIDGAFMPSHFNSHEPVRRIYDPNDLTAPSKLLAGSSEFRSGSIFLKGQKHKLLYWFKWSESSISSWHIWLDDKFFERPERTDEFLNLMVRLCESFPIIYGGVAPQEDWEAKHWFTTDLPGGGTSSAKVGLSLEGCLPGVYWITLFGANLVSYFGHSKIKDLPTYRTIDTGSGGTLLMLRENPLSPALSQRLLHDSQVMDLLGRQYFFLIDDRKDTCQPIPGIIDSHT